MRLRRSRAAFLCPRQRRPAIPPACVLSTLHRPLTGIFIVQNVTVFVNVAAGIICVRRVGIICVRRPLTAAAQEGIMTVKSKPRTRLAPQLGKTMWQGHKINRHFAGVAVDFLPLCAFAFLEVFRTITVTVNSPIWKVRRIRITPFRRDGTNRLRVFCLLFTVPLRGFLLYRI